MRHTLWGLALWLVPALVHADHMKVTSYDMDGAGGTVRLQADAPLGEPWLRIEGRTIKIWFPHIVDVSRFDHERESGEPIRALALRPGASDTALLRVELGTGHHLTRNDIVITRDGLQAAVRLRVPTAQPAAALAATAAGTAQAPPAASPAAQDPAPAAAPQAAQPKAAEPAAAPQRASSASASDLAGIGAAAEGSDDEQLGTRDETGKTSPVWLLGAASVLLACVYFGLQHLQRGKLVRSPLIEIVGSRRLGHRQQLLIVRALGADHLLLCTHGRAERVASSPNNLALPAGSASPENGLVQLRATSAEPSAAAEPDKPSQAGGIGLMSRLSSQHRLRKLLDSVDGETSTGDGAEQGRSFDDELLTATRTRRALLHSLPAPAARQSDAVAGITRLRQRKTS